LAHVVRIEEVISGGGVIMLKGASCREVILSAVYSIVNSKGTNEFTVKEVVDFLVNSNTTYSESTIRTHIASRCCANAPKNHAVVYNDFERIKRGTYKLINL
jgi:hypothetical protein